MHSNFRPDDIVRICVPAIQDFAAPEMVFQGRITALMHDEITIALRHQSQNYSLLPPSARCIIRKSIPFGILESDAAVHSYIDKQHTVTVTLLGAPRNVQRRTSCRLDFFSSLRYRDLTLPMSSHQWDTAELRDISLGGVSLLLQNAAMTIGKELLIEFSLNDEIFRIPAVVRRIEGTPGNDELLCAVEFLDIEPRQQNRLSKAMTVLQLKILSSRVRIDYPR